MSKNQHILILLILSAHEIWRGSEELKLSHLVRFCDSHNNRQLRSKTLWYDQDHHPEAWFWCTGWCTRNTSNIARFNQRWVHFTAVAARLEKCCGHNKFWGYFELSWVTLHMSERTQVPWEGFSEGCLFGTGKSYWAAAKESGFNQNWALHA